MIVDLKLSNSITPIGGSAEWAQLRQLPIVYFLSAIFWILWPILQIPASEKNIDYWPIRIGIFFGLSLVGYFSYSNKFKLQTIEWMGSLVCSAAIIYVLWVGSTHSWPMFWMIGTLLVVIGGSTLFSYFAPLLFFLCVCLVFGGIAMHFLSPDFTSANSFLINYNCAIGFAYIFSLQKRKIFENFFLLLKHQNLILDNLQDGLVLHDQTGKIVGMNSQAPCILGLSLDQIMGKTNLDPQWKTFHADGRICPPEEHPSSRAQETGEKIESFPLVLQKKEGEKAWLEITAIPLFNPDQDSARPLGVLVILRDETLMKRSKEVIDQQNISLEAASRLAALGEMAGGIAHEINNPLAIIVTQIGLLKLKTSKGVIDQAELFQSLNLLDKTANRIAKIISSMRSLVRQNPQDIFEVFQVSHVLDDVLQVSSSQFQEKGIKLNLILEPQLKINANRGQIGQLVINLLNNSIDAVSNLNEKWIEIRLEKEDNYIVLSITDSGPGLPKEIQDKILQPFFTTKEKGNGTGLGLSLVQTIANQHGAVFYLDKNCPNTRFIVKFPVSKK